MKINRFKQNVDQYYRKKGNMIDLDILKKYNIKKSHIFIIIASLIFLLFHKEYFLLIVLILFSTVFSFYHSKLNRSPIDFKFALVIGLFITRYYGLLALLTFFIISDIFPALLGGDSLKGPDLFFIAWYFIVNSIVFLFPHVSLTILGPVLVVIEAIGSMFINSRIGGIPGFLSIWISIIAIIVRIIYLLTLGRVLEFLFTLYLIS